MADLDECSVSSREPCPESMHDRYDSETRSSSFRAALVAAIGAAGCFPVVSNQQAAQQDAHRRRLGRADVCTAPQLLALILGGVPSRAEPRAIALRRPAPRRRIARGIDRSVRLSDCPRTTARRLARRRRRGSAIRGLPHQVLVAYRVPRRRRGPRELRGRAAQPTVADFWQDGELDARGGTDARQASPSTSTFRRAPEMDAQLGDALRRAVVRGRRAPRRSSATARSSSATSPSQLARPARRRHGRRRRFGLPAGTVDQPYAGPFNAPHDGRRAHRAHRRAGSARRCAPRARHARITRGWRRTRTSSTPQRPVECLDERARPARRASGIPTEDLARPSAICPLPSILVDRAPRSEVPEHADRGDQGRRPRGRATCASLGGEGFAEQGTTASVPFTLRGAGAPSATRARPRARSPLSRRDRRAGAGHDRRSRAPVTTSRVGQRAGARRRAAPGTYDVHAAPRPSAAQQRTGTGRVVVLPKAAGRRVGGAARPRQRLHGRATATSRSAGSARPRAAATRSTWPRPKAGIAPKANTAAVSKPRLLRIARGKFAGRTPAKRARVKVRLFPKARRARAAGAATSRRSSSSAPAARASRASAA